MNLAKMIDHTLLKPDAKGEEVEVLCREAIEHGFYAVCINPNFVELASRMLKDSDVKVCTVIGFPLGAHTAEVKAMETENAIQHGADEVDMVIDIGLVKDKKWDAVYGDIQSVVQASQGRALVKVILETCLLSKEEIKKVCEIAMDAKAEYVKTSTGFSTGGATVEDVRLMAEAVKGRGKVKASGGIRSRETALAMVEAGASRLGASAGIKIIEG